MALSEKLRAKLDELADRYREMMLQLEDPTIQGDHRKLAEIQRESGRLQRPAALREDWLSFECDLQNNRTLAAGEDAEMAELAREELELVEARGQELEEAIKKVLIRDAEIERSAVIMEIRAGTGGDEAALWAADLFRMYSRFAESMRWKIEILNTSEALGGKGYKEIDFRVAGDPEVYRRLRFEAGGHRVQRVPETEAQGRIHTSAATVAIMPEVEEVEVQIRDEDLEISAMRAGGPGGQHQNKTSSAIRIVHTPTGVSVVCREKSQHQNRREGMRILRSKLFQMEEQKRQSEQAEQRRSMVGSGDRSQRIRTYNFPQNRVTDHRINTSFSLELIIAGRLETLTDALIEFDREERLRLL